MDKSLCLHSRKCFLRSCFPKNFNHSLNNYSVDYSHIISQTPPLCTGHYTVYDQCMIVFTVFVRIKRGYIHCTMYSMFDQSQHGLIYIIHESCSLKVITSPSIVIVKSKLVGEIQKAFLFLPCCFSFNSKQLKLDCNMPIKYSFLDR